MSSPSPFEITPDGSVVRSDGSVIHYSAERFVSEIVKGNACFICGVAPDKAAFNDEHVIPKWLLRSLDLFDCTVTLPSGSEIRYGQWTLPCCVGCNTLLGERVETPVSEIMKGGYERVVSTLQKEGIWILFHWVNLIFLKTYLKSMALRMHLDHRKGDITIGETIDWGTMHHIHCVARSIFTGTKIDPRALGSFFLLPAKQSKHFRNFDYMDVLGAKTVMIQFNEIAMFCVLDDACGTITLMQDHFFSRISGPLSAVQQREVLARIAYSRRLIKEPPEFHTQILNGEAQISTTMNECVEANSDDPKLLGTLMHRLCAPFIENPRLMSEGFSIEALKEGQLTFF